jgi:hypothetical protein
MLTIRLGIVGEQDTQDTTGPAHASAPELLKSRHPFPEAPEGETPLFPMRRSARRSKARKLLYDGLYVASGEGGVKVGSCRAVFHR